MEEFRNQLEVLLKIQHSVYCTSKAKHTESYWKAVSLKPKQSECLQLAFARNDIIACLPTGYGKSLLYEVLPYLELEQKNCVTDSIAIVVMPLNAIIDDQLYKLGKRSIKVEPGSDSMQGLAEFKYILGHPETILDDKMHDILLSISSRVSWIVVDEAHCIVQWGHSFRPLYEKLDRLRAIFPDANVLALTATASIGMREEIARKLVMHVSF